MLIVKMTFLCVSWWCRDVAVLWSDPCTLWRGKVSFASRPFYSHTKITQDAWIRRPGGA